MLLLAMMTIPIMSVALTGRASVGRAQRRMSGAYEVRRLAETLKAYVTADRTLVHGPGAGVDGWNLPGDSSGLSALQAGHHRLDPTLWTPSLAPYGGTISYDVAVRASEAGPIPDLTFNLDWNEP